VAPASFVLRARFEGCSSTGAWGCWAKLAGSGCAAVVRSTKSTASNDSGNATRGMNSEAGRKIAPTLRVPWGTSSQSCTGPVSGAARRSSAAMVSPALDGGRRHRWIGCGVCGSGLSQRSGPRFELGTPLR
jgi:hypothetical protein